MLMNAMIVTVVVMSDITTSDYHVKVCNDATYRIRNSRGVGQFVPALAIIFMVSLVPAVEILQHPNAT
ncbi:unnamed protein product [Phytophthora lilii]|uniref:Unnamed protein product n=1 Tax=Phytophthora lilii TaxID=2077276 RepID=A0A9W6WRI9_9STRA|nr:unnamed protein product [Phytophthora lilii]